MHDKLFMISKCFGYLIYLVFIQIYLALGQYTESLADINKAIEIKPAGRLYFLKGTIEFAFDVSSSRQYAKSC